PILGPGQETNVEPLPPRGQMTVLRPGRPPGGSLRQPEFRAPAPGLFLLPREPLPQRVYQVVVSELIVLLTGLKLRHGLAFRLPAFGIGRRDEPDFAIQNPQQILEILWPAAISRDVQ